MFEKVIFIKDETITINKDCVEYGIDIAIDNDNMCNIVCDLMSTGEIDTCKYKNILLIRLFRVKSLTHGNVLRLSVVTDGGGINYGGIVKDII